MKEGTTIDALISPHGQAFSVAAQVRQPGEN
jgi:hypothetical protein